MYGKIFVLMRINANNEIINWENAYERGKQKICP